MMGLILARLQVSAGSCWCCCAQHDGAVGAAVPHVTWLVPAGGLDSAVPLSQLGYR